MSKSAFSMLELVIVIVTIGILAAAALPRLERNVVREAAVQLANHIRYTQHLAMVDNPYTPNDPIWYKTRWTLLFNSDAYTNDKIAYTIFSDYLGRRRGNPETEEMAVNPLDPSKVLSGGFSGELRYDSEMATPEMNLGERYQIVSIDFSKSCQYYGSQRFVFDYYGRPMKGNTKSYGSPYPSGRLIRKQCVITLCTDDECAMVAIEPETGYAHIVSD